MRGNKILLRALEPSDAEYIYRSENDSSIWRLSNTMTPISKFIIDEYIASSYNDIYSTKQLRLIIELTESKKVIGSIDLFDFDPINRRAGIGILIGDKSEQKKGYASESLKILIDYSFNTLNLHQLYCHITTDNDSSINLFKQHDFQLAGKNVDWIFTGKNWLDAYFLQLINKF